MPKLNPYSSNAALSKLDGRTKEARLANGLRADLIQHVGEKPSTTQLMLINQAVQLQLHIALLDRKSAERELTDHDSRYYLAWCNSLSRLLRQIGLKSAPQPRQSLTEHLAQRPGSTS